MSAKRGSEVGSLGPGRAGRAGSAVRASLCADNGATLNWELGARVGAASGASTMHGHLFEVWQVTLRKYPRRSSVSAGWTHTSHISCCQLSRVCEKLGLCCSGSDMFPMISRNPAFTLASTLSRKKGSMKLCRATSTTCVLDE
eukprot:58028-Prymnesium_polylepis.1